MEDLNNINKTKRVQLTPKITINKRCDSSELKKMKAMQKAYLKNNKVKVIV